MSRVRGDGHLVAFGPRTPPFSPDSVDLSGTRGASEKGSPKPKPRYYCGFSGKQLSYDPLAFRETVLGASPLRTWDSDLEPFSFAYSFEASRHGFSAFRGNSTKRMLSTTLGEVSDPNFQQNTVSPSWSSSPRGHRVPDAKQGPQFLERKAREAKRAWHDALELEYVTEIQKLERSTKQLFHMVHELETENEKLVEEAEHQKERMELRTEYDNMRAERDTMLNTLFQENLAFAQDEHANAEFQAELAEAWEQNESLQHAKSQKQRRIQEECADLRMELEECEAQRKKEEEEESTVSTTVKKRREDKSGTGSRSRVAFRRSTSEPFRHSLAFQEGLQFKVVRSISTNVLAEEEHGEKHAPPKERDKEKASKQENSEGIPVRNKKGAASERFPNRGKKILPIRPYSKSHPLSSKEAAKHQNNKEKDEPASPKAASLSRRLLSKAGAKADNAATVSASPKAASLSRRLLSKAGAKAGNAAKV